MKTRESIELRPAELAGLKKLAAKTKSVSASGPAAGQPSWRVLVARIGRGELLVTER